jgi:hypothetical protein
MAARSPASSRKQAMWARSSFAKGLPSPGRTDRLRRTLGNGIGADDEPLRLCCVPALVLLDRGRRDPGQLPKTERLQLAPLDELPDMPRGAQPSLGQGGRRVDCRGFALPLLAGLVWSSGAVAVEFDRR